MQVRACALSLTVSSIVGILKIFKCTVYLITKIAAHSNIKYYFCRNILRKRSFGPVRPKQKFWGLNINTVDQNIIICYRFTTHLQ